MCMFKALLENQGSALHENSGTECSVLTEANFYKFYEVQNLKWTEVIACMLVLGIYLPNT